MRKIILIFSFLIFPFTSYGATYSADNFESKTCAYSTRSNPSYSCDKSFDSNASTFYQSAGGVMPDWIYVDTVTPVIIDKIAVDTQDAPIISTFEFQGSNSTSTWELLGSFTHENDDSNQEFLVATTTRTSYRYFRFNMTDAYGSTKQSVINEFMGFTCTDCEAIATSTESSSKALISLQASQTNLNILLFFVLEILFAFACVYVAWVAIKVLVALK